MECGVCVQVMNGGCARNETIGNELPCAQCALGRGCCGGDRGVGGGGGWCLMMEYVYAGVERGVPMGRTHTGRTYTGGMNWGTGAVNWCTAQGLGGLERRRTCRRWGEREGKMMICGRACREPPTTLTASWWAGYSGREGGGEGASNGQSPGGNLVVRRHLCEASNSLHSIDWHRLVFI